MMKNWVGTDVAERDLVYYSDVSAYGVITAVVSGTISHTPVSGNAGGIGGGSLAAGSTPVSGNRYAIIDTVELNVIPVSGLGFQTDNTGTLTTGSSALSVRIESVEDWTKTEVRKGDFVFNETRNEVSVITAITTAAAGGRAFHDRCAGRHGSPSEVFCPDHQVRGGSLPEGLRHRCSRRSEDAYFNELP